MVSPALRRSIFARWTIVIVAIVTLLAYGRAQSLLTLNWTTTESVALLHRYCQDNTRDVPCDSTTLRPLANRPLDVFAVAPYSDLSESDAALYRALPPQNRTAIVLLGSPPTGVSYETFYKKMIRTYRPSLLLIEEDALVAGFLTFETDATPKGGQIRETVPVIAFTRQPAWTFKTGQQIIIPEDAFALADDNLWEDAFLSTPLLVCRFFFVGITALALVHALWRLALSYRRKLHMKIFPLSLRSTRPIALWSTIVGITGRLLFMLIDPMSAFFLIPSSLSGVIGVFGVPWSLVTSVVVLSAWLFGIRRKLDEKAKRIRRYQIIGLCFAGFVILLAVVSMIVDLAYLHALSFVGLAYFMVYCVVQAALDVFLIVMLVKIWRISRATERETVGAAQADARQHIYLKGGLYAASGFVVLITFALFALPTISGNPIPYLISSTLIAYSLAGTGAMGLELFDYSVKGKRGSETSSGSTTTAKALKNSSIVDMTSEMRSQNTEEEEEEDKEDDDK